MQTTAFQTMIHTESKDINFELIDGQWPDDIYGDIFISAAETSNQSPSVLFGPGCLIRFSLRSGQHQAGSTQFAWRSRCIQTPSNKLIERVKTSAVTFSW